MVFIGTCQMAFTEQGRCIQVDHWLNKRPFDRPDKDPPKKVGRVIIIGAGPAGLAAAQHLKVRVLPAEYEYEYLS